MKKILLIGLILLLTGCVDETPMEPKKLACTIEISEGSISETMLEFDGLGEEPKNVTISTTVNVFKDVPEELVEDLIDQLNVDACQSYINETGVTCESVRNGENLINIIKYDLSKTSDEFLARDGFIKDTYDNFKTGFEEVGYICE